MSQLNIPQELISICYHLVKESHKKMSLKNLPKFITLKENVHIISSIPVAVTVLKSINASFKIRKLTWVIGIVLIILAIIFNYWFFSGLIIVAFIDIYLAIHAKDSFMFLAKILVSVEILADNFAGWGTAFPTERSEAIKIFDKFSITNRTFWLDYYLGNRDKIEPDIIKGFGPNN